VLIPGGCHCGNLRFLLTWRPEPKEIQARECTCSFCRKHGGVWTSCPQGALEVTVQDPAALTRYTFGTRTADFHVCARCGVVPVVTSRIEGRLYAVVSVHALEGLDPALVQVASADFGAEDEAARLERRARRWIADVKFPSAGANQSPA